MTARFSAQKFFERLRMLGDDGDREVAVFDEIDSTSSELRRRLQAGAQSGLTAVAHRQTGGRGRLGRTWHSPLEGNLCFSVVLKIAGPIDETIPLLPLAAGLAAHEALTEAGAQPYLKWPNDVLVHHRKLAGILCEAVDLTKQGAWAVVGIGVNIAQRPFPPEISQTAIALNAMLEKDADMSRLAARFLFSLENWNRRIGDGERTAVVDAWRKAAEPFGRRVKVGEVTGKTVDLAPDGRLIIQDDEGQDLRIAGGIVESLDLF